MKTLLMWAYGLYETLRSASPVVTIIAGSVLMVWLIVWTCRTLAQKRRAEKKGGLR